MRDILRVEPELLENLFQFLMDPSRIAQCIHGLLLLLSLFLTGGKPGTSIAGISILILGESEYDEIGSERQKAPTVYTALLSCNN